MRSLTLLDYSIMAAYVVLCFWVGLRCTKQAGKSMSDYFVGGRSMPWWLLGTSMAATNFSTDTPLAITKLVFNDGIAGCWFMWSGAMQVMLAVFLFSKLWRRSEVITDVEIVEHRYGAKPASVLRLFKGFYFGVMFNCIIMGFVYKGLIKMISGVTALDPIHVVIIFTTVVIIYSFFAGFYGVVWTDFIQYVIMMISFFTLAFLLVQDAGGMSHVLKSLSEMYPGSGITDIVPSWPQDAQWMPMSVFFTYIGMQWWSHKYADGGGKHIQRMLSAKNETHAVGGTFFFSFMGFIIQIWPMIIIALASIVIFGRDVKDPEMMVPMAIAKVMPSGLLGLILVSLIAAFMSTISTHVNLGGSYLINDIYRRFIYRNASEAHYVIASRTATLIILGISILIAMRIDSIADTWKLIMLMASGAGATWILRWFWWRVNAWSEFSAMATSAIVTFALYLINPKMLYSYKMWIIVGSTTIVWLAVTFLTKPVDEQRLVEFVRKVKPSSFGWKRIYNRYPDLYPDFSLRKAVTSWLMGLVFLFSLNSGVGNILLLNTMRGSAYLVVSAFALGILLFRIMRQPKEKTKLPLATPAAAEPVNP